MDRRLLKHPPMKTLSFAALACLMGSLIGCGGEAEGSGDLGGEAVCPLNAVEREEIDAIFADSLLDAAWITVQSPGYSAPVERACGAQIPFADVPARFVMTVLQPCSEEQELAEHCPDDGGGEAHVCTQFSCTSDGTLVAAVSLDALPANMAPSASSDGVVVRDFEHKTRYSTVDEDKIAINWATAMGIEPTPGRVVSIATEGSAEVHGPVPMGYHVDVEVSGVGEGEIAAAIDSDGTSAFGMGSIDGEPVVLFDMFGSTWIGPCTPH
jgi:hypothetical protein